MDEIEIRRVFGKETFRRGREYFDGGRVDNVVKLGSSLFAEVYGTSKYLTSIRTDSLESRCSCPVGYNCKHGAALAMHFSKKDYTDGDKVIRDISKGGGFQLIKLLEKLVYDEPFLVLKIQQVMEVDKSANSSRASFVEKEVKVMLEDVEQEEYADPDFVERFSKFVRMYRRSFSKEIIFYALEFFVKKCEDYGYFYNDYEDDYFGDPVFENLCDALVSMPLEGEDMMRLGRLEEEDEYNMLDPFIARLASEENAPSLANFSKVVGRLFDDQILYAKFLVNAGKKEEARKILRHASRDTNGWEILQIYLKIDRDEALKFAADRKDYSSLISYYHQECSHDEVIETFRECIKDGAKIRTSWYEDAFPFEAVFDSLAQRKPSDYQYLSRKLFDLCIGKLGEYDLCVEIALALDDKSLLVPILKKANRSPYSLETKARIRLLKRLYLSEPTTAKSNLRSWIERLISNKDRSSYSDAASGVLVLREMSAVDEWNRYLESLIKRHYRKITFIDTLRQKGIVLERPKI